MILYVLIAMVAGWIQRHQQQIITSLQEEKCVLKAHLGGRRLRLADTERRRLAALAHLLGRKRLKEIAAIATPDTLLRWYKGLIAQQFDGSMRRTQLVMLGERALYSAIHQSLSHYHAERNHQDLGNQLIAPEPGMASGSGQVRHRERLGGLLSYDYRDAA